MRGWLFDFIGVFEGDGGVYVYEVLCFERSGVEWSVLAGWDLVWDGKRGGL